MELTPKHKAIINAEVCPYCRSTTKVVSEEFIYGRSYRGHSVICCSSYPKCDSYVGTHTDGSTLGRLANKGLRQAKKFAHDEFDLLWKGKYMTRSEA